MPAADRVLDFAERPARLRVDTGRLVIESEGETQSVPLSEIAVVMLSQPRITLTQPVLAGLAQCGASLVVCDEMFLPSGILLPLANNALQSQRIAAQVAASKPTNKRLWQQVVKAKIRAQAATLRSLRGHDAGLETIAREVRSGDPQNLEAQAAQRYWPALFDDDGFRRRREAPDQNRMLNYGYTVLRAAVARAVCAAGLHPSIGMHHHSRTNPMALADDLIEPYRTLVDETVVEIVGSHGGDIAMSRSIREQLVEVLRLGVGHEGESRTVLDHLSRTAASLMQVYLGESRTLYFPEGLAVG